MLHVTNGASAVLVLQHAALEGDFLSWDDVLHEGPVRGDLAPADRRAERATFIAGAGWASDAATVEATFTARDARLAAALREGEPVALWFEHDLYDQWQLVEVLAQVAAIAGADADVELVLPSDYIGNFRPGAVYAAWDARTRCTALHLGTAVRAWLALTGSDPQAIDALRAESTDALPHLHAALTRHAEEFPDVRAGLARTERQLLEALEGGPRALRELFVAAHHARETAVFLGDTVFLSIVARLALAATPLVRAAAASVSTGTAANAVRAATAAVDSHTAGATPAPSRDSWARSLELTDAGRAALAGRFDHARANRVSRWLGGMAVGGDAPDWRWDAATARIVRR